MENIIQGENKRINIKSEKKRKRHRIFQKNDKKQRKVKNGEEVRVHIRELEEKEGRIERGVRGT